MGEEGLHSLQSRRQLKNADSSSPSPRQRGCGQLGMTNVKDLAARLRPRPFKTQLRIGLFSQAAKLLGRYALNGLTLFAILMSPDGSVAAGENHREMARKISAEGVPNMAEVTPRLYRGGQPSEKGLETLARMGIGIVVDGRGESGARKREGERVRKLGMQYVEIPWHCPFPKDRVFARFLKLIRENPDKEIFVHCRLGDDRAGMMIASYRMAEQHWTAEEAMQEMKADGFEWSHHLICPGLAGYEKSFPQRFRAKPEFRGLH